MLGALNICRVQSYPGEGPTDRFQSNARKGCPMVGGALKSAGVDDFDLRMSDKVRPLYEAVKVFIREEVDPITEEYHRLGETRSERWAYGEGQLELLKSQRAAHADLHGQLIGLARTILLDGV